MERLRRHPIATAIIVFFIVRFASSFFVGPTTCSDGWQSASIGRRGACSHHGGVGTNGGALLATLFSLGCGIAAFVFLSSQQTTPAAQARPMPPASPLEPPREVAQKPSAPRAKSLAEPEIGNPEVEAEADALIRQFEVQAYGVAWRSEQEAQTGHWRNVALAIARKTRKRIDLDTAARIATGAGFGADDGQL